MTEQLTTEISVEEIEAGKRAYQLDRDHVFHSWQAQGPSLR